MLEKGVKLKDPESLYTVGRMYMEGIKYDKNINKGIKLLLLAANRNHPGALFLLSNYYLNGILVKQDIKKSKKLMEKAKEIGIGNDFYSKHSDLVPFWEFIVTVDPENILFDSILNKARNLPSYKTVKYTKLSEIVKHYSTFPNNVSVVIPEEYRERLFKELKEKVDEFRKKDYPLEYEKYVLAYISFLNFGYGCKKDGPEIFKSIMDLEFIGSDKWYNIKGVCYETGVGTKKNEHLARELYIKAAEKYPSSIANINLSRFYKNKKYKYYNEKLSFDHAIKSLDNGNVKAIYELAHCYLHGIYVKADYIKAASLYRFGDRLNYLPLLKKLGVNYLYGVGCINKNIKQAIEIFKKCDLKFKDIESVYYLGIAYKENKQYDLALQCFRRCEKENFYRVNLQLALAYDFGLGVPKNKKIALQYYLKIENDPEAGVVFNNLGVMYKEGKVVEKDYEKMIHYYTKSYELKTNKAYNNLAYCYLDGVGVKTNIEKGLSILDEGIKDNKSSAYIAYGFIYKNGSYGIKKDHKKAFEYFSKAAELKDVEGYYQLAWCYVDGIGCVKSDYFFMQNLNTAKKLGFVDINYAFGYAHYKGLGVSKDHKKAEDYFKKSIKNDEGHDSYCYGALGYIYEVSYRKLSEAFEYYKKAADLDDAYGHLCLGSCYYDGKGCLRDKQLARKHWTKASELGDRRADSYLRDFK